MHENTWGNMLTSITLLSAVMYGWHHVFHLMHCIADTKTTSSCKLFSLIWNKLLYWFKIWLTELISAKVRVTVLLTRTPPSQRVVRHASVHALPCDWSQLLPSNQRCCRVVRLWVITKICEWIGPAYSANLLTQACNTLKERWFLAKKVFSSSEAYDFLSLPHNFSRISQCICHSTHIFPQGDGEKKKKKNLCFTLFELTEQLSTKTSLFMKLLQIWCTHKTSIFLQYIKNDRPIPFCPTEF